MDFIALDVATANADMSSVCAIGLIHFKDGEAFKDARGLVDPDWACPPPAETPGKTAGSFADV